MKELLNKYGLVRNPPISLLEAAERKSSPMPTRMPFMFGPSVGKQQFQPRSLRRRKKDLLLLAESPLPSRAIRLVRNAVCSLHWGMQPKKQDPEGKQPDYSKSMDLVNTVLNRPNADNDDFSSFLGAIVEDILIFDAGVWEYVEEPKYVYENDILALEVVPGYTIAKNRKWNGDPKVPRWLQVLDDGTVVSTFLDTELEYVMMRNRSFDPFGLSPLETAVEIMDTLLQLYSFQREIASSSYPNTLIFLGDEADDIQVKSFRIYWENELKGRGTPGFFGGMGKVRPEPLPLKPTDDSGLFLQYHDLLVRILSVCFDLHPQDFGLERDVNRSTAEVGMAASLREAIKPIARTIAIKLNTHVLPRIADLTGNKQIKELEFFWTDIDPKDEARQSTIDTAYAAVDAITLDEMRKNLNLDPLPNDIGKLTATAYKNLVAMDPTALLKSPEEFEELMNPPEPEIGPDGMPIMPGKGGFPPGGGAPGQPTPKKSEQAKKDEKDLAAEGLIRHG